MDNEILNPRLQEADKLYADGRIDEALTAYRELIVEEPSLAWAYSRIGGILAQRGDASGAEAALTRALELDPELPQAHSNLGNLHYTRGEFDKAEARYRAAITIDPGNPLYHENLHAAYKKQRKYTEAIAALKASHRLKRNTESGNESARRPLGGLSGRKLGCGSTVLLALTILIISIMVAL